MGGVYVLWCVCVFTICNRQAAVSACKKKAVFLRAPKIYGQNSTSYEDYQPLIDVLSVRDGEERKRTWGERREDSIVIERGRHKQTWLPRENMPSL